MFDNLTARLTRTIESLRGRGIRGVDVVLVLIHDLQVSIQLINQHIGLHRFGVSLLQIFQLLFVFGRHLVDVFLARHIDVLWRILPDNDFHDMDLAYWKAHGWAGPYRPYYGPDFSVIYDGHFNPHGGEGTWDHVEAVLRAYLASYHVGQYIQTRFYWRNLNPYSGYNDFNDVDLARLKNALEDIKATADAHHARVGVFLIPRATDFMRLHESGANRLGPIMEAWGRDAGIPIKDLLPDMDTRAGTDYRSYFLPCDGHWSAKGNETAAQILEPWLGEKK